MLKELYVRRLEEECPSRKVFHPKATVAGNIAKVAMPDSVPGRKWIRRM